MATTIQVFDNHDFGAIRTINDGGHVLFCGKDVATALGYVNTKDALARHCKGVVKRYPLDTPGGTQHFAFITEGDLYRLIASSKLPAAERFESWVFDEALPSIRRHGMYAIDELLQNDEFLEEAIRTLRAERLARLAAEQALLEAAPKISYYNIVLKSSSLLTTTEIAKDYGLSAKRLNEMLHAAHVQFKQSGRWFLYAKHAQPFPIRSESFKHASLKGLQNLNDQANDRIGSEILSAAFALLCCEIGQEVLVDEAEGVALKPRRQVREQSQ